jgi:hypothetical protein
MQGKGIARHITFGFDDFSGIIPSRRFVRLGQGKTLPDQAYDGIIEGLLEPEPTSWLKNPEFPCLWRYLMHDICKRDKVILLSFEILSKDKAFVVDRAHVERMLYKKSRNAPEPTKRKRNNAFKKYWESRIPVFDYHGGYNVPQLAIWSPIETERLRLEWVKPTDEVWNRVLANNW